MTARAAGVGGSLPVMLPLPSSVPVTVPTVPNIEERVMSTVVEPGWTVPVRVRPSSE